MNNVSSRLSLRPRNATFRLARFQERSFWSPMTPVCRVAAIGEILWDVFDNSRMLGGAPLNFAAHAARLGSQVLLVSAVGDDEPGRCALAAIRNSGVDIGSIQRAP